MSLSGHQTVFDQILTRLLGAIKRLEFGDQEGKEENKKNSRSNLARARGPCWKGREGT